MSGRLLFLIAASFDWTLVLTTLCVITDAALLVEIWIGLCTSGRRS